jgi:GNAT superfamily N-acetyltransferase
MALQVVRTEADVVAPLRELHRQEMNCQIVHDSFLARGLSDPYLIRIDGKVAGYGLVANRFNRDAVDEYYITPSLRRQALPAFRQLIKVSGATKIRVQTNDRLLLLMLYDCARNVTSDTVLFADAFTSSLTCDGAFRRITDEERATLFKPDNEAPGDHCIEYGGSVIATGGVLFHYNPPYGDIFMDVEKSHRRRGFGSFLVQELKRTCYEMGKVPAARCNIKNVASRRTLEKAGMLPCGRILIGEIGK